MSRFCTFLYCLVVAIGYKLRPFFQMVVTEMNSFLRFQVLSCFFFSYILMSGSSDDAFVSCRYGFQDTDSLLLLRQLQFKSQKFRRSKQDRQTEITEAKEGELCLGEVILVIST